MKGATPDFLKILRILREERVDFIVVGGVCGVLQGAPVTTFDLEVLHSRKPGNLEHLLAALKKLGAHYRTPGKEKKTPERSHLASEGHQLLMTRVGPLDLLGIIGKGRAYEDLLGESDELEIGGGIRVRVLRLPALIKVKEETAGEKDKAVLSVLRRTLEEKTRS